MNHPIPVTLVTGFLGAGKTTLLNHVLEAAADRDVVVIENEFGDVDIDGALVQERAGVLFALTEGCVCCTVRDDLVEVFDRIRTGADRVDHVIVEASGLADPAPVLRALEGLGGHFRADGVVTVVDARHAAADLQEHPTAAEQIAYADLLVLNKVDLRPTAELDALEARLRTLNPLARVVRTEQARVAADDVLGLGGHDPALAPPSHDHHHHHDDIGSVAVEAPAEVDLARLDQWLGDLLRRSGTTLLRMKGFLAVEGMPQRFTFHAVRYVIDVQPEGAWGDRPRHTRLVLIGRGLDQPRLQAEFESCLAR